jgi:aminocarboxymuconate-semialdehyde decarboxylase
MIDANRRQGGSESAVVITDLHCHVFPVEAARRARTSVAVEPADDGYRLTTGSRTMVLDRGLFDLDLQLDDMLRQGVVRRALSVPPFTLQYGLPRDEGIRWARALNEGIAEIVGQHPNQLAGLATAPLQDVPAAVDELEYATGQLGLVGVEIATNIHGVELDDPALDPFWARSETLGMPILIHPNDVAGVNRMGAYYLNNLVGNPIETALAGARLLFGGVLERYPGLRVILAHGGGALPHLIGRLAHGYAVRPEARERARAPIEHLRRLYFDTVVFDAGVLRHVVETAGAAQVVLGTDYPFDMGETDPVGFVRGSGLDEQDVDTILGNGERLLRRGR